MSESRGDSGTGRRRRRRGAGGEAGRRVALNAAARALQALGGLQGADCLRLVVDLVVLRVAQVRGLLPAVGPAGGGELGSLLARVPGAVVPEAAPRALAAAWEQVRGLPEAVCEERLPGEVFQGLREAAAEDSAQRKAARARRRGQGTFFTPRPIVELILDLVFAAGTPRGLVCDPAMGTGHFLLAVLERVERAAGLAAAREFARQGLRGMDNDPEAVRICGQALWLRLARPDSPFVVPESNLRVTDALLDPAPWPELEGGLDAVVGNPPYDVLTNFRSNPAAATYARRLREHVRYRLAITGQINLYRCFIERGLQLLKPGGMLGMVVPASLLMDRAAAPLRRELVFRHRMDRVRVFDESERVFAGVGQAVVVFRAGRDRGRAEVVRINASDVRLQDCACLGEELPLPRAGEEDWRLLRWLVEHAPRRFEEIASGRVGEVDQTAFRACMRDTDTGTLLLRGCHLQAFAADLRPRPGRQRFLDRGGFLAQKAARGRGDGYPRLAAGERVAQLGIRNLQCAPRLLAARVPAGVFLGNSLNAWEPRRGWSNDLLLGLLNSSLYDWRFRLTSSNNNVNVCEVDSLPLPARLESAPVRAVERAARACEAAAAAGCDLAGPRRELDRAVCEFFGLPATLRFFGPRI